MKGYLLFVSFLAACLLAPGFAAAQSSQEPAAAPPPVYAGSFGGGFGLTGGNSATKNVNLSFGLVRDPKTKDVFKVDALYLRSTQNDVLSLDRSLMRVREEHTVSGRAFLFSQMEYLRDRPKDIRYLLAPTGGVGYKVVNNDRTVLSFSGGAGGIWEKNTGLDVKGSGSLNAGESLSYKVSPTATFVQAISQLWKTNDFSDYLTNFSMGVSTSINKKMELKVEFLDSFKNRPPNATIKKNDTAFVTTVGFKF